MRWVGTSVLLSNQGICLVELGVVIQAEAAKTSTSTAHFTENPSVTLPRITQSSTQPSRVCWLPYAEEHAIAYIVEEDDACTFLNVPQQTSRHQPAQCLELSNAGINAFWKESILYTIVFNYRVRLLQLVVWILNIEAVNTPRILMLRR